MKKSIFVFTVMIALASSAVNFAFVGAESAAENQSALSPAQTGQLAAQLPSSDAVVIVDMQRLIKDALPQMLASRMQILNEVNAKIDEVKGQTGIDLRQFEQLAVGVNFTQKTPDKLGYEPLVLARGKFNAAALIAVAKLAAKGKYREEKSGVNTIYVFSAREILQANKSKTGTPKQEEDFKKMLAGIPAEISVMAFDDATLAIGLPTRVRETAEGKSHVSADVLSLANRKPNSIVSFGGNVPQGLAQILKLDNDEFGKSVSSLRQVSGAMDVSGGNTIIAVAAKTFKPEQAKDLEDTLAGLKMIGVSLLGGAKGDDKKIYARMVENAKISRAADEVMIDLQVANSDINVLVGKK